MRTVKEVSKLTGVSVRTLHHYDAIGLLKPTEVTKAGYRLYDDTALGRLQNILLFRELRFPLKEIKAILDSPDFDPSEALAQQIRLLELQYKHLGELISFAREIQEKGVRKMDFHVFDKSEIEEYKAEAKEKWGNTKEYKEYEQKQGETEDFGEKAGQLMKLFAELGALRTLPPADKAVQGKIKALQNFITSNYYACTAETLRGLGQMYVEDERFKNNIDRVGGEGTAAFVREAIEAYC
ncbi:MAG TPA: MerR family transcriptional regulator [Candidatus Limivivens intestinipullorum]|uniref:MerR family transcriptional regulator n=1 Tax=Candidatus Limivivens intestinipullorum TaxID=2840858 RepID=A0A9D1ER61_9FIRM|nr:MerR family transcriptional regulator [Candidatus Limivivens intestinipullorum]